MDMLETGTHTTTVAAAVLETGTHTTAGYVELETGTHTTATFEAVLETGTHTTAGGIALELLDTFIVPNPAIWDTVQAGEANKLVLRVIEAHFSLQIQGQDDTDLSPYILDLSLTRELAGKTTLKINFTQHSPAGFDENGYPVPDIWARMQIKQSDLNPLFLGTNAMTNKILSHRFDRKRQATLRLVIDTEQGPQVWTAPRLLMGTPRLNDEEVLEWSGEGILAMLEKAGKYYDDIVPGDNVINYAHDVFRMICTDAGITDVQQLYPNYPIRQLRMSSGTRRSFLDQIVEPYKAHIVETGDGLRAEPIAKPLKTPKWAWVDYLNIMGLEIESLEGWKNKIILSRLQDQSAVVAPPSRCSGGQCVGEQSLTVSEPSNYVIVFVKAVGNSQLRFYDFQYWDEQGNALGPKTQAQNFASAAKIARVTFVSEPYFFGGTQAQGQAPGIGPSTHSGVNTNDPNAMANYLPEYEWVIMGGSEATSNTGGDPIDEFNTTFSFTEIDAATQAIWGDLEEGDSIEIGTVPDAVVGLAAAKAMLWENVRKIFMCTFDTPYVNPWAEPGDVHSLTHWRKQMDQVPWLCEKDTITMDRDKSWTQSFEMYRGLVV